MKLNLYKSLVFLFFFGFSIVFIACKKGKEEPEQPTPVTPEVPNLPAPVITSISSTLGSYGDYIIINGANFGATASENTVKVNGKIAHVYQANTSQIGFLIPKGAGNGAITIVANGKTATYPNFTYVKGLFVSKFIGDGTVGYLDGKGFQAKLGFSNYTELIVDADDNIYSNDVGGLIRKTTPDALITTIAGSVDGGKIQDGPISTARFGLILHFVADKQKNFYVTEPGVERSSLRKISSTGIVSTILKDDTRWPSTLTVDADDNLYVFLDRERTIMKLSPSGTILGTYGPFNLPNGFGRKMLMDSKKNFYFFDNSGMAIYKITLAGDISLFAGKDGEYGIIDGPGTTARFHFVEDFIIDKNDNIFVLQNNQQNLIRKVMPDGTVTTLYKRPNSAIVYTWPMDDTGKNLFGYMIPGGRIAVDSKGNFFIWDSINYMGLKCQPEL